MMSKLQDPENSTWTKWNKIDNATQENIKQPQNNTPRETQTEIQIKPQWIKVLNQRKKAMLRDRKSENKMKEEGEKKNRCGVL